MLHKCTEWVEKNWRFFLGTICCPETSVSCYHPMPRDIPEEPRRQFHRRRGLKSLMGFLFFRILHNVGLEPRCAHLRYKIVQTLEQYQLL